jgi:hypothetical protein
LLLHCNGFRNVYIFLAQMVVTMYQGKRPCGSNLVSNGSRPYYAEVRISCIVRYLMLVLIVCTLSLWVLVQFVRSQKAITLGPWVRRTLELPPLCVSVVAHQDPPCSHHLAKKLHLATGRHGSPLNKDLASLNCETSLPQMRRPQFGARKEVQARAVIAC